jgi:hypothetical protein
MSIQTRLRQRPTTRSCPPGHCEFGDGAFLTLQMRLGFMSLVGQVAARLGKFVSRPSQGSIIAVKVNQNVYRTCSP